MEIPVPVRFEQPDSGKKGIAGSRGSPSRRLTDVLLSTDPRRRIRMSQWMTTALVYVGSALVLWFGMSQGWTDGSRLLAWCGFVAIGLAAICLALRTGWSEQFSDPALTAAQMVFGVVTVEWGYLMAGPMRTAALFPLLLIFTFGAFSLDWRRITWLTAFAIVSLVGCVLALHAARGSAWSLDDLDLRVDLANVLMVMVVLPALSMVAARLSSLRSRMSAQRAVLTELLRKVQDLATHDDLTGLANRRHGLERLTQEGARFERQGRPFSIAIIDMDHFKDINDAHGHAVGDEVLKAFAAEATSMLRAGDVMARWGGEEFLLLLPDTGGPQAQASVTRLLDRVRALPHRSAQPLSFSAGVTEHRAGETVAETVARADREMYVAKRMGRNAVRLQ